MSEALPVCGSHRIGGGGRRIRTFEPLSGLTVFKTAAIDHSAIPPLTLRPEG